MCHYFLNNPILKDLMLFGMIYNDLKYILTNEWNLRFKPDTFRNIRRFVIIETSIWSHWKIKNNFG